MAEQAITLQKVDKVYPIYHKAAEKYLDFFLPKSFGQKFYALRDITFSLEKGTSTALIGLNGSGKSTLANLIAGASAPTSGTLIAEGNVSMTSISAGVSTMLTGLENITQKCLLLGLSYQQIKDLTPQIVEFADLGAFMDQQVKTYSSGMRAKLGFAISVNIDPDVLIIDEALSVGDPTFTKKCLQKMQAFRERGKTIVFVSHSLPQVRDFCDHALWLEAGQIRSMGACGEVTAAYAAFIKEFNAFSRAEQKAYTTRLREKQFGGSNEPETKP
ncbi:MAG: ATP-binding cassette domain-containing protein [Oscillospiraceae bacterium]|nr:ATP-binding cassette domain-containing protein [Oscillospiraceae bacterium]